MKYFFAAEGGQRIPLRIQEKVEGQVTFIAADSAVQHIASKDWVSDVLKEVAATSANPQAALSAVLGKYRSQHAGNFELEPMQACDLQDCVNYFEEVRKRSLALPLEDDWWARPEPFTPERVRESLQVAMA